MSGHAPNTAASSFRKESQEINGRPVEVGIKTFGNGRMVTVRKLPLHGQWQIMKFAPPNAHDGWFLMAVVAASVLSVDGRPANMGALSEDNIASVLDLLDEDGLSAAREAANLLAADGGDATEAARMEQAGNSPALAASASASSLPTGPASLGTS